MTILLFLKPNYEVTAFGEVIKSLPKRKKLKRKKRIMELAPSFVGLSVKAEYSEVEKHIRDIEAEAITVQQQIAKYLRQLRELKFIKFLLNMRL